eukprot:5687182-Amphidinium_carterae.1
MQTYDTFFGGSYWRLWAPLVDSAMVWSHKVGFPKQPASASTAHKLSLLRSAVLILESEDLLRACEGVRVVANGVSNGVSEQA